MGGTGPTPARFAIVTGVVAASTAYGAWLIPTVGIGVLGWLRAFVIAVGTAATSAMAIRTLQMLRSRTEGRPIDHRIRAGAGTAALLCGAFAVMVVPVIASVSIVSHGEGVYDTPFESPGTFRGIDLLFVQSLATAKQSLPELERARFGAPDLLATPDIYDRVRTYIRQRTGGAANRRVHGHHSRAHARPTENGYCKGSVPRCACRPNPRSSYRMDRCPLSNCGTPYGRDLQATSVFPPTPGARTIRQG